MSKTARVYKLVPQGLLDLMSERIRPYAGQEVQKIQPVGTPRNGSMGQCFVQTVEGDFIGLVNLTSLVDTGKRLPVRDKAAEAREARSQAIRKQLGLT